MWNLLHRLGYTYKKPKLLPANPDEAEQDFFLSCYLEFMKNKPEDASNSGRGRFNIHGAMDAETYETTTILFEKHDLIPIWWTPNYAARADCSTF
jgi:hypothetical protein